MGMKARFQSWSTSGMSKGPKAPKCLAGRHVGWSGSSLVGEEHGFRWPKKGRSSNFREQTS